MLWRERRPIVALMALVWLYVPVHDVIYPDRYFGVVVTALAIVHALAALVARRQPDAQR